MSDIKCPYDGDFCRKKQDILDRCANYTIGSIYPGFAKCSSDFSICPIADDKSRRFDCARFRRYEYIVQKHGLFIK